MKIFWLNFHNTILNTLREIEFSFKESLFFEFVINKYRWYIKF